MYFGAMYLSLLLFIYFYLCFGCTPQLAGSEFLNQELILYPRQWKCGVLTTGLPMILDAFMFVIVKSS